MRWPWEDTNHLSVSKKPSSARARAMPATPCMVAVTATSMSTLSARGTSAQCSPNGVSQKASDTATSASSRGGPGTLAEATAMAAARAPASRAAAVVSSEVAKKPQEEPISARTPTPIVSARSTSCTRWLRTSIFSVRVDTTRASAYEAPAARAASTAAVA